MVRPLRVAMRLPTSFAALHWHTPLVWNGVIVVADRADARLAIFDPTNGICTGTWSAPDAGGIRCLVPVDDALVVACASGRVAVFEG